MNLRKSKVSRSRVDDPDERTWRDHAAALMARAHFLTQDPSLAADLVQDVLERALRERRTRIPQTKLRGWMMVVLYHLFVDLVRTARTRRPAPFDPDFLAAPDAADIEPEPSWMCIGSETVRAAIEKLPPTLRMPLEKRQQGESYNDIASELGICVGTVGTRVHRAHRRLRRMLEAS